MNFFFFRCRADVNSCDNKGNTALHVAAQYGNMGTLEYLIECGSNIWALDDQGRTPATVARNNNRLDAAQYLDTQASYWELQNVENARKLKMKAMDQLKKRASAKRPSTKPYSYGTVPSIRDNRAETNGSIKRKVSTEEALRANFELRPPELTAGEAARSSQIEEEEERDSFPQLAPIPKTQTAILLNTLHAIPPSTPPPEDTGSQIVAGDVEPMGEFVLTNQITQNDSTLATFLHSLDLLDCIELLHREKIDLESLSLCEEKDLISIGMPLGHRKKILYAFQRRKEVMANPGNMVDTDL